MASDLRVNTSARTGIAEKKASSISTSGLFEAKHGRYAAGRIVGGSKG